MKNAFWVSILGAGFAAYLLYQHWHAMGSGSWPTTDGKVTSAAVNSYQATTGSRYNKRKETRYRADILYQYSVDTIDYQHSEISSGYTGTINKSEAESLVRKYAPGSTIKVFYDPSNPAIALLKTGVHDSIYAGIAIGALLGVVGGVLFVRQLKS